MKQYQQLLSEILTDGSLNESRNGNTVGIFGHCMTFKMEDGFPIPTVKQTYWKTALRELKGFTSAFTSAKDFRDLGCGVWDRNANLTPEWLVNPYRRGEDDIGPVYGKQWRHWPGYKTIEASNTSAQDAAKKAGYRFITQIIEDGKPLFLYFRQIDMMREALETIHKNPGSRRIIFHGWNPAELDEMSLPPCHLLYQFGVDQKNHRLSLNLYIRSNDIGLGAPFNIVEAAFLLHLFARLTGYTPYKLTYMIGDAHLYDNQLDMAKTMLEREPYPLPKLVFSDRIPSYAETNVFQPEWLDLWAPEDVSLENYQHWPAISVEMRE